MHGSEQGRTCCRAGEGHGGGHFKPCCVLMHAATMASHPRLRHLLLLLLACAARADFGGIAVLPAAGMDSSLNQFGEAAAGWTTPDLEADPITFTVGLDGKLYGDRSVFSVKGINWYGSESRNGPPDGLEYHTADWFFEFLKRHNFNAVRLLFNHESMLNDAPVSGAFHKAPELIGLSYSQMFLAIAKAAAKQVLRGRRLACSAAPATSSSSSSSSSRPPPALAGDTHAAGHPRAHGLPPHDADSVARQGAVVRRRAGHQRGEGARLLDGARRRALRPVERLRRRFAERAACELVGLWPADGLEQGEE